MSLRRYNIYFHTHTISGIFICAILYVIFFAGTFSFFKDEIAAWQNNSSNLTTKVDYEDYDYLLDSLSTQHDLLGRDFIFYFQENLPQVYVSMTASQDSVVNNAAEAKLAANKEIKKKGRRRGGVGDGAYFTYDFSKRKTSDYAESYSMGEFLYRLHFLAQANQIPIRIGYPFGYALAGLVSFIFLFALITGLLLHWDKLVSNFFIFRPGMKWKNVWTDMHTALGVIGFPYQFMYALTGIVLIVNTVLILPYSKVFFDGESDKVYNMLDNNEAEVVTYQYKPIHHHFKLSDYLDRTQKKYPNSYFTRVMISNYGDTSMQVTTLMNPKVHQHFAGKGSVTYRVSDEKILAEQSSETGGTYADHVQTYIRKLHYGDYGGYPLKVIYFALGVTGCLVIISGILIWLVARDKNNVPMYKRKFNFWASNVFLAICLSMLPVTAITFIAIKLSDHVSQSFIYNVYFYLWLAFSVVYIVRRNIATTNRETLFLGAIVALIIPIVNGVKTGKWMWVTARNREFDILIVDLMWFFIGVFAVLILRKMSQEKKKLGVKGK